MTTSRPIMQSWFVAFVAVTGVLSVFPYRERALLPAPSANEQGFLAQEITRQGTTNLVNDTIAGAGDEASRGPLGGAAGVGSGARRLIPALARVDGVPGTSGIGGGLGGTGGAPGTSATLLDPALGGGDGNGTTANLAGGGPAGQGPVGGGGAGQDAPGPLAAPAAPTILAGAAGELLAAVVPEPSTWAMFVIGLMTVGHGLRRGRRAPVRILLRS